MSTKGTPRQTFRLPNRLAEEIDTVIARRNLHRPFAKMSIGCRAYWRVPEWTRSSFILAAIREKLDKMQRSRRPRRRAAAEVQP